MSVEPASQMSRRSARAGELDDGQDSDARVLGVVAEHWSLEEQLQGAQQPTHFGQVLRDLGTSSGSSLSYGEPSSRTS
jgi:hypothetical protein